jgi:hypothetical protein
MLRLDFDIRHRWTEDRKVATFLPRNTKDLTPKWIPRQGRDNLLIKGRMRQLAFLDGQFELPGVNQYHKAASRGVDILDVLRSLQEHSILTQQPCPYNHQSGLLSDVSVVKDLVEEDVVKLV